MARGTPLAEAFVRIRPTSDGFRLDTQNQVKKAVAGIAGLITIKPDMDVTAAKATLTAKVAALTKAMGAIKIPLDDKAAMARLLRLGIQLDRIKVKADSSKLTLRGTAAVEAQLLGIEGTLDRLQNKFKDVGGGRGLLGQFFLGGAKGGVLGGLQGAGKALPGIGQAAGASPAAALGVVATLLASLPFLAQAAAGAITFGLGGALTGVGVYAASKSKDVQKSFADLQAAAATDFGGVGTPFNKAIEGILREAQTVLPVVAETFTEAIKPIAGPLGDFGKQFVKVLADPQVATALRVLGESFGKMLKALTPQIAADVDAFAKAFTALFRSASTPQALRAMADFVSFIAHVIADSVLVIAALSNVASWIEKNWKWDQWFVLPEIAATAFLIRHLSDFRQWLWNDFIQPQVRFLTQTIPTAYDILKESVRITWDRIKILFLQGALAITHIMGELPGPLGSPFRRAHQAISKELAGIQADVRAAADNINADWQRLHGKSVTLTFTLGIGGIVGGGGGTQPGRQGYAAGTGGAAPGWAWVGERGPELAFMHGGETVIPSHIARGYAAGTGFGFRDRFSPPVGVFGGRLSGAFNAAQGQFVAANRARALAKLLQGLGGMGPSPGGAGVQQWTPVIMQVLSALEGPPPAGDLGIVLSQMQTESGGNPYAVNLWDSNARAGHPSVGLMQVIAGTYALNAAGLLGYPSPVAYGVSEQPYANIFAGLHYAMSVYGNNWRNVLGHGHGYDQGGWLMPGASLAINRTGRPERVVGPGGINVHVHIGGSGSQNDADRFLLAWLRRLSWAEGGGDVQVAFGRG